MTELKPILYFDMDGVLVDFRSGIEALGLSPAECRRHEAANDFDEIEGIFSLMQPTFGAVRAVKELAKHYDVRILTTAPWKNPSAWSDKLSWVKKYFDGLIAADKEHPDGNPFHKKITVTHRKESVTGQFLIDDKIIATSGSKDFMGKKIWFRYPGNSHAKCEESLQIADVKEATNWYDLLDYLMPASDQTWRQYEAELIKNA